MLQLREIGSTKGEVLDFLGYLGLAVEVEISIKSTIVFL